MAQAEQMVQRADRIVKFRDMYIEFLCLKHGIVHSFYKDPVRMPELFKQLFPIFKMSLPNTKESNDQKLMMWLIQLCNDLHRYLLPYKNKSTLQEMGLPDWMLERVSRI